MQVQLNVRYNYIFLEYNEIEISKIIKNYYRIVKFELYEIYVFLAYIFVQDYTLLWSNY